MLLYAPWVGSSQAPEPGLSNDTWWTLQGRRAEVVSRSPTHQREVVLARVWACERRVGCVYLRCLTAFWLRWLEALMFKLLFDAILSYRHGG